MTDDQHDEQAPRIALLTTKAAEVLAGNQGEVLNLWVDAVVEAVPGAARQTRTELSDHLQNLLDDIACALDHADGDYTTGDIPGNEKFGRPSTMHGRERASMSGYTVDQIVKEYVVLRRTLKRFFLQHGVADAVTLDVVTNVVERASLDAVKEFSCSIEAVQQKLIGTLVHDVRTPLGVAYNYAELLGLADLDDAQRKRAVQTIGKSLKRAGSMLEDLLDTVTLEAGQGLFMRFNMCDISEALLTVCSEADQLYGERSIAAQLPNAAVTGVFDLALIIRTVENLISNAVKFGDMGQPITVSLSEEDDFIGIRVHNHGNPIAQDDIGRIFDFFASSDRSRNYGRGWGLGLALVKTVVQSHGGQVILESSEDGGTVFGMTLCKDHRADGSESSVLI